MKRVFVPVTLAILAMAAGLALGPQGTTASDDATAKALEFIEKGAASLVGAPASDFHLAESVSGPSGTRVSFTRSVHGIPVLGADMAVHVRAGGDIDHVEVPHRIRVPRATAPSVSEVAASGCWKLLMQRRYGTSDLPSATSLAYDVDGTELRLCWMTVASSPEGAWLFLVSAEEPGITYLARRLALDGVTGTGQVYMENPKSSKSYAAVSLTDLDSSRTLRGLWAHTYNANGQLGFTDGSQMGRYSTAANQANRYVYTRTDRRFTEVMAYYHVTRLKNELKDKGLTSAVSGTMPVVVNVQDDQDPSKGYDNAFYTRDYRFSSTGILVFGSGEVYRNLAEDSDVIYHEYGHAVLDRIQRGLIMHWEHVYSGAIHEGVCDAVAAHMNGDSKIGEWGLSRRRGGAWEGRDIDNDHRYPDDVRDPDLGQAEVHYTGMILGGLYWDLRRQLGPDMAVTLWFDSLTRLGPRADFFDFRDALLEAELAIDHNENLEVVNAIITARGLAGEDPGNKSATVLIGKMQTRHFDWDAFKWGDVSETFEPGSWIALTASLNTKKASPGYFVIPRLKFVFPPDIGTGGYLAYYVVNEEFEGTGEYLVGLLYSPDYAAPAKLGWKLACRLGDQTKYSAEKMDEFRIQ